MDTDQTTHLFCFCCMGNTGKLVRLLHSFAQELLYCPVCNCRATDEFMFHVFGVTHCHQCN